MPRVLLSSGPNPPEPPDNSIYRQTVCRPGRPWGPPGPRARYRGTLSKSIRLAGLGPIGTTAQSPWSPVLVVKDGLTWAPNTMGEGPREDARVLSYCPKRPPDTLARVRSEISGIKFSFP